MAHSAMHFTIGLAVGTAAFLPSVARALRRRDAVAPALARWIGASWALALFAIVPSLLRHLGVPDRVCSGWWMNVFLFHSFANRWKAGGMLIGELGVAACMTLQYVVLLVALRRVSMREREPSTPST